MGVLDPPPQRTGGCGGPRPRCSAASPPQRRPKRAALPEQRVRSCRSAVEAVPASVTERETAPDVRRIEPNHGRNRPLTPTYGRAALKCSAAPAAEQDRRSTFGRRAASALLGASHDVDLAPRAKTRLNNRCILSEKQWSGVGGATPSETGKIIVKLWSYCSSPLRRASLRPRRHAAKPTAAGATAAGATLAQLSRNSRATQLNSTQLSSTLACSCMHHQLGFGLACADTEHLSAPASAQHPASAPPPL